MKAPRSSRPRGAYEYLASNAAAERLNERRFSLDPGSTTTWLVRPDRVIEKEYRFSLGGMDFQLNYLGSAHSDGDMTLYVVPRTALFSGDIIFEGRVPFVGDADTNAGWRLCRRLKPAICRAGSRPMGRRQNNPVEAVAGTREYHSLSAQGDGCYG